MSGNPLQLVVAAFKDEDSAQAALKGLKQAQREKLIRIENAAVLRKDPKGKLHIVGAAPSVEATVFPLLIGQKSFGASPLGSPATMGAMLEFAARHGIEPVTETYPMSKVNDAFERLRSGKARYRIVLENDF